MCASLGKRRYSGLWLTMYQSQNDILHSQTGLKKSDILKISDNHNRYVIMMTIMGDYGL